jgi:hypothetical protein
MERIKAAVNAICRGVILLSRFGIKLCRKGKLRISSYSTNL